MLECLDNSMHTYSRDPEIPFRLVPSNLPQGKVLSLTLANLKKL